MRSGAMPTRQTVQKGRLNCLYSEMGVTVGQAVRASAAYFDREDGTVNSSYLRNLAVKISIDGHAGAIIIATSPFKWRPLFYDQSADYPFSDELGIAAVASNFGAGR